ncbi:hypothetical protein VSU19_20875 [Verrucomicrobiales bacterium BCK34]|nr:hypothetical protein [Verrucomicrobiales bacterium BCK34]
MKFSLNRLAFIVGAFILALMAIDGLIQMNKSVLGTYGAGESSWVEANSAAALLLVGLVAGMLLGIGCFFAVIVWRQKKLEGEPDQIDILLEEIAQEEANALFVDEKRRDESNSESLDPWERTADWWKSADDE